MLRSNPLNPANRRRVVLKADTPLARRKDRVRGEGAARRYCSARIQHAQAFGKALGSQASAALSAVNAATQVLKSAAYPPRDDDQDDDAAPFAEVKRPVQPKGPRDGLASVAASFQAVQSAQVLVPSVIGPAVTRDGT